MARGRAGLKRNRGINGLLGRVQLSERGEVCAQPGVPVAVAWIAGQRSPDQGNRAPILAQGREHIAQPELHPCIVGGELQRTPGLSLRSAPVHVEVLQQRRVRLMRHRRIRVKAERGG